MIGKTVGHYRVTEKLGEGGMGEVYRARDERLNRDVALKILPEAFAQDADRMARFSREAQLLASLNHPNIAAIHGLEEADGIRCLVLELVEGETLAERIARGPLPVDEALPVARQVAEALDAAHDRGVIHRDLKPANVKITPEGTVKVLDFGLAKAFEGDGASADLSKSPTLTSPAATQAGVILGTAAYMSPEQAKGKPVDHRADVWTFGVVFHEMLTGRRAFEGETVSETLAAVMMKPPDLAALPGDTPAPIRRLLARCLERDPRRRLQAIGEARILLEDFLAGKLEEPAAPVAPAAAPSRGRRLLPWALAGAAVVAAAVLGFFLYRAVSEEARVVRAFVPAPPGTNFYLAGIDPGPVKVSPDGSKLVFSARDAEGTVQLWVRDIDSLEARPLQGTDGPQYPFWSADSRSLGFFADGKLKKIDAAGGPPLSLCDAGNGKGGTWNREGVILYTPDHDTGIHRVSAAGGECTAITEVDSEKGQNSHRLPHFLPDGHHFLFLARYSGGLGGEEGHAVMLGSLDGAEPRLLLRADSQAVYASGHLLFLREQTLMARPFDSDSLEFTGEAFPLAEDVMLISGAAAGVFSASRNGVLAYLTGEAGGDTVLTWFDREGQAQGTAGKDESQFMPAISPDAGKIAVTQYGEAGTPDIWIHNIARDVRTRFTFDPAQDVGPVWSPDGRYLAFASNRGGTFDLYVKAVGGLEDEKLLYESDRDMFPTSWSPDGRYLVYFANHPDRQLDIGLLPIEGYGSGELEAGEPVPFLQTPFMETQGRVSPDGKWLAYASNESGQFHVYVTSFPRPGRKWQVSTVPGGHPRWSPDGSDIYYQAMDGRRLMATEVDPRGETFVVGQTRTLFETSLPIGQFPVFDVSPRSGRFLVNKPAEAREHEPLTLVVNWPR